MLLNAAFWFDPCLCLKISIDYTDQQLKYTLLETSQTLLIRHPLFHHVKNLQCCHIGAFWVGISIFQTCFYQKKKLSVICKELTEIVPTVAEILHFKLKKKSSKF